MEEDMKKRLSGSPLHDYIAGALGGGAGILIGHPFDTVKVQLQTQAGKFSYSGTVDAMKNVNSYGLMRGTFRGMSWPLLSYGIVNAVFFGVYGNSLKLLQWVRKDEDRISNMDIFLSGCLAGAASVMFGCPIDLFKVVLQSQIPHEITSSGGHVTYRVGKFYKGPWECAVDLFRKNGIRGWYKGLVAMLYRDVPSFGLYCSVYEYLSSQMHRYQWTDSRGITSSIVAGGCAGISAWVVVMPLDFVKSRLQSDVQGKYKGIIDCFKKSAESEGIRVLFRGTLITCLRAFPVNATTFLVYSQTLQYLSYL